MSERFGEKLRTNRIKKGKTLEELAAAIDSSKAYVWQLENKTNAKPSAELLLRIANYFGRSPDYFLDDEAKEQSTNQMGDAFFRKFKRLSDDDQRMIDRIMFGLDNDPEK